MEGGYCHPIRREQSITRLARNFSPPGELEEKAISRTVETVGAFADSLKQEGAEAVFAVATGVLREAKNREAFVQRVFERTGLSLRVLSGEEEAHLMLRGVLWYLKGEVPARLVADIGGGSTEIVWVEGRSPKRACSLNLGAVILSERFLRSDPPQPEEIQSMEAQIKDALTKAREGFAMEGLMARSLHPTLVGTAGTMTTLAAIDQKLDDYDPERINGYQISSEILQGIYVRLRSLSLRERKNVPGLEEGREDLIVAGAAIVLGLLEVFRLTLLLVVDSGLLEGVLLEGIFQLP